jgi:hypothetical protein
MEYEQNEERLKKLSNAISKAESKYDVADKGCYCGDCLKRVAEEANDAIWDLLCENEEIDDIDRRGLMAELQFYVIRNGIHSKLVRGIQERDGSRQQMEMKGLGL